VEDPKVLLARKRNAKEAKLYFTGHVLIENRNGMVRDVTFTQATSTATLEAVLEMLEGVHY
jgi:hypothetical protein